MTPLAINPRVLRGPWQEGFALDVHTTTSTLVGYDERGRTVFSTKRSEVGDMLYRLKYMGERRAIGPLAVTAAEFLARQSWDLDVVIPIPPSRRRYLQPVVAVGREVGRLRGLTVLEDAVGKVKGTRELKNIADWGERSEVLASAYSVDTPRTRGMRVLLFDDLYRSGATASVVTNLLLTSGEAERVFLLTLTETTRKV